MSASPSSSQLLTSARSWARPASRVAGAVSALGREKKPRAPTLISWPPPPVAEAGRSHDSVPPPRPRESTLDLSDDDLVDVEDPMERLQERVGELEFLATAWQAAGVCAAALTEAVRAEAVLVHAYDARTRELRTIGVSGKKAQDQMGASLSAAADAIARTVVTSKKAMSVSFEGRDAPGRLRSVGASALFAAPATWAGRCFAVLEVLDAQADGVALEAACAFVTKQLASFLSSQAIDG